MSLLSGQQPSGDGQGVAAPAPAGGAGNPPITDWRTSLPEDLRSEKVFESIKGKDINEAFPILAKNYVHAQKLVGAEKLVVPGPSATPEELSAFYTKLGRPAKPEEYSIKLPEGLTEDRLDKVRVDTWRKELHDAGIPKVAAERLLSKYLADEHGAHTAAQAAQTKALEQNELSLKQEFGTKFDEKVNHARWAVKEFGSDALLQMLDQTGLGSHPEVVKLFAKIGESVGDDRARGQGSRQMAGATLAPETAQHELTIFNKNPENTKALFDANHPRHDAVVSERKALFEAAFPKMADKS